jgi:hypothetical protein
MRPTNVTVSSQTTSSTIPVDYRASPFKVSLGCKVSAGGDVIYKVQHTFDEIFNATVTPVWFDHITLVNKIASADGAYISPVRAIRLNITTWTSGSVEMEVIQNGR